MNVELEIYDHFYNVDYFVEPEQKSDGDQPGHEKYICIENVYDENGDDVTEMWEEEIYNNHYELLKDAVFHMNGY